MTSTKSYQKLKAKVTAMEQENTRLKGGGSVFADDRGWEFIRVHGSTEGGATAMKCPICDDDAEIIKEGNGDYELWCDCGYHEVIEQEHP